MKRKRISAQFGGFTPLFDGLVSELGLIPAAVFGVVFRYCQLDNGACFANQTRLSDHLGISRQALNQHLRRLVEAGYLEDMTPNVVNRPHTYRDTGKAALSVTILGSVNQDDTTVILDDTTVNEIDTTVNQDDTKRLLNRQENRQEKREKNAPPSPSAEPMGVGDAASSLSLLEKAANRIRSHDGIEPDIPTLERAIGIWAARVDENIANGGNRWSYTNLEAIHEIYDALRYQSVTPACGDG